MSIHQRFRIIRTPTMQKFSRPVVFVCQRPQKMQRQRMSNKFIFQRSHIFETPTQQIMLAQVEQILTRDDVHLFARVTGLRRPSPYEISVPAI